MTASPIASPPPSFAAFVADFHAHFTRNPNACVRLGVERRLGELPDPSMDETDARLAEARALLAALEAIPRAGLTFDDDLDLDLARLMLEAEVHRDTYTFNGRREREQLPAAGPEIGNGIYAMFLVDPRPAAERLADITSRIEAVPAYLDALLARLDVPVARWAATDAEEARHLHLLFETIEGWAERKRWPDLPRLRAARAGAEAALEDYVARLRAMPVSTRFHLEDADARRLVRLAGIDLSFETLHEVARDFLARTAATVEALRASLARKHGLPEDVGAARLQAHLSERYRVPIRGRDYAPILERYEAERARILAFVRERDLFPIPADQDMKIIRTPRFMIPTIPAGAMNAPAPFRGGVRTSQVFLTLTADHLDEHTELSIPTMMIHEGIPGHHLQLAMASMHPSVIRRHNGASDHAEGWTTMLEDSMLDAGYGGDLADEMRFVAKREMARLGARVAIDLFFMTGDRSYLDVGVDCDLGPDDPFAAAGNLLRAVTGFGDARVEGELNWYSIERGIPLSYLAGNHLVRELKRDLVAAAARAGRDTGLSLDRAFHRVYLESGNMPVRFLRRVFGHEGML